MRTSIRGSFYAEPAGKEDLRLSRMGHLGISKRRDESRRGRLRDRATVEVRAKG
jgi:hypothetical protein